MHALNVQYLYGVDGAPAPRNLPVASIARTPKSQVVYGAICESIFHPRTLANDEAVRNYERVPPTLLLVRYVFWSLGAGV